MRSSVLPRGGGPSCAAALARHGTRHAGAGLRSCGLPSDPIVFSIRACGSLVEAWIRLRAPATFPCTGRASFPPLRPLLPPRRSSRRVACASLAWSAEAIPVTSSAPVRPSSDYLPWRSGCAHTRRLPGREEVRAERARVSCATWRRRGLSWDSGHPRRWCCLALALIRPLRMIESMTRRSSSRSCLDT